MFGSQILDVALGIILVFLLASLIASALREAIESKLKTRAVFLERGIRELLDGRTGTDITKLFYEHPIIYSLFRGGYDSDPDRRTGGSLPAYIPAKNFAEAIIDLSIRGPAAAPGASAQTPAITVQALRLGALEKFNPQLARAVLVATDHAGEDLAAARKNLEDWYDSSMDRVSGWYKRNTHYWLLGIGFVMAAALNLNALRIGEGLWRDKTLRESLAQRAQATAQQRPLTDSQGRDEDLKKTLSELETLNLPIGWTDAEKSRVAARFSTTTGSATGAAWYVLVALVGYLFTALAVSMGAPFWFDLLSKVIVLRSTVKPHEKSPEEASKDRQAREAPVTTAPPTASSQPAGESARPSRVAQFISAEAVLAAAGAGASDGGNPNAWATDPNPDRGII